MTLIIIWVVLFFCFGYMMDGTFWTLMLIFFIIDFFLQLNSNKY
jgi:hypothetical protein